MTKPTMRSLVAEHAGAALTVFGVAAGVMSFLAFGPWGLAGLVILALSIAVYVLWRSLHTSLSSSSIEQSSPDEGDSEPAPAADLAASDDPDSSTATALPDAETDPDSPIDSESEVDEEFAAVRNGIDAAFAGDLVAAKAHLDEWVDQAEDDADREKRITQRDRLLMTRGDDGAVQRLEERISDRPEEPSLIEALADGLYELGQPRRAAELAESALDHMKTPADRARVALAAGRARLALGEVELSHGYATQAANEGGHLVAAKAHAVLADIAKDSGDATGELHHRLHAVECDPTDDGYRFEAAYRASTTGFPEVALYLYRRLERTGGASPMALNNLGAAADRLDLPGTAITYWKRAIEKGVSLAAGNLANAAVSSGHWDLAARVIEEAPGDDPSPRVGEAAQRLAAAREDESNKMSEVEAEGQRVADAVAAIRPDTPLPTGTWDINGSQWLFEKDEAGNSVASNDTESWKFYHDADGHARFEYVKKRKYALNETANGVVVSDDSGVRLTRLEGQPKTLPRFVAGEPVADADRPGTA